MKNLYGKWLFTWLPLLTSLAMTNFVLFQVPDNVSTFTNVKIGISLFLEIRNRLYNVILHQDAVD